MGKTPINLQDFLGVLPQMVEPSGSILRSATLCRYEEDVDERLDASVKRILQENRRTAQELQLHMDESSLLLKENQILLEERDKLLQVMLIERLKLACISC
jgi:hypothetical protein